MRTLVRCKEGQVPPVRVLAPHVQRRKTKVSVSYQDYVIRKRGSLLKKEDQEIYGFRL